MAGSRLHMSMGDMPFSQNGKAGSLLLVCVTDKGGKAVTGLKKSNFKAHWLLDVGMEKALASFTVEELDGSGNLPDVAGAYALQLLTKNDHWSKLSANVVMFVIAVTRGQDRGRMVYKVSNPLV